jgi:hypothetical protein
VTFTVVRAAARHPAAGFSVVFSSTCSVAAAARRNTVSTVVAYAIVDVLTVDLGAIALWAGVIGQITGGEFSAVLNGEDTSAAKSLQFDFIAA